MLTIYPSEKEKRKTYERSQCLDPSLSLFIHCQVSFDVDSFLFSVESHHADSNGGEDTSRAPSEADPGTRCSRCTEERSFAHTRFLRADVL